MQGSQSVTSMRCPIRSRLHCRYSLILGICLDFHRKSGDHLNAIPFQTDDLLRIIGQKRHFADPEITENLGPDAIIPEIALKPELEIGLDGIHTLIVLKR